MEFDTFTFAEVPKQPSGLVFDFNKYIKQLWIDKHHRDAYCTPPPLMNGKSGS
jgi:hypothetical protein